VALVTDENQSFLSKEITIVKPSKNGENMCLDSNPWPYDVDVPIVPVASRSTKFFSHDCSI